MHADHHSSRLCFLSSTQLTSAARALLPAPCRSVEAQVQCLLQAWAWQGSDHILHSLPLHHTHGIINALYCAQAAGATVHFMPKFSPSAVWSTIMVRAPH